MSIQDKIKSVLSGNALAGSVAIVIDGSRMAFDENGHYDEAIDADCTLTLSEETLKSILSGETDPMGAYFSGELTLVGDMAVAMSLSNILKA